MFSLKGQPLIISPGISCHCMEIIVLQSLASSLKTTTGNDNFILVISFFLFFSLFFFCMLAIHSGTAVLKTKLHPVYNLLFVILWKQRSVHAIVEVWPYSQNIWSQNFCFLTPHSLTSRVKVHFEWKLNYHFTYLLCLCEFYFSPTCLKYFTA
jgi:hypothetical protein